jgi:hypothetical protein
MPGRTRGLPTDRNAAQETNERAAQLDNKAKWLDLLKADAMERNRAIMADYAQAFKPL